MVRKNGPNTGPVPAPVIQITSPSNKVCEFLGNQGLSSDSFNGPVELYVCQVPKNVKEEVVVSFLDDYFYTCPIFLETSQGVDSWDSLKVLLGKCFFLWIQQK